MKRIRLTKAALALSAILFVVWWMLGAGATIAWFSDTDTVRNEFQVGLLRLEAQYKNDLLLDYEPIQSDTEIFNDHALYEPGYTQVVYLKLENMGDVDFNYKIAVTVENVTEGKNVWGDSIYLPKYLSYGVVFAQTEAEMLSLVNNRLSARDNATDFWNTLGTWSYVSPHTFEAEDDAHYAAIIIYMPEDVGNVANYRDDFMPSLELGVSIFAQQTGVDLE